MAQSENVSIEPLPLLCVLQTLHSVVDNETYKSVAVMSGAFSDVQSFKQEVEFLFVSVSVTNVLYL